VLALTNKNPAQVLKKVGGLAAMGLRSQDGSLCKKSKGCHGKKDT